MNYQELTERLRQYNGVVECRVQHPKTGNYCISFDWHNSINPKREADEWLANQKKRFPEHEYSTTYVVKEVCVLSKQDEACHKAADAIESILAENERLKDELAKYRDAPVVAWCHYDYAEKTADYLQHFKDTYASIPLIVKPGEQ